MTSHVPTTVESIHWPTWSPRQHATLLFVIRDGRILLIRKKRGLGAGKINGPGGRLDPGESPMACAVRETQEELLVTPVGVRAAGELRFQFVDGLSIHGYVFTATGCDGDPSETDEATPLWTALDAIPYDDMWQDDRHWLPHLLEDRWFDGRFVFDDDAMLDMSVDVGARPSGIDDHWRTLIAIAPGD